MTLKVRLGNASRHSVGPPSIQRLTMTIRLTVGEKDTVKKSKESVQKPKDPEKEQVKAIKSRAKQQRRALLKKGMKYQVRPSAWAYSG
jgi:hypothetical protein